MITHAHLDHLNRWTLKSLDRAAKMVVPKGAKHLVTDLGYSSVQEVEPGDQISAGALDIVVVDTKHDRGRWRKGDRPICVGYLVCRNGIIVHHAGDVDMSTYETFDQLGHAHQVDVSLLPIGGFMPTWYYRWRRKALDKGIHIDPDTALEIADRIGATKMIPIHWGTLNFRLGQLARASRQRLLRVAQVSERTGLVALLKHREQLRLDDESENVVKA